MKNQINMINLEPSDIDIILSNPFYECQDADSIIVLHKPFLEASDKIYIFKNINGGISVWTNHQINSVEKNNDNE